MSAHKIHRGFSLIELLVVIAIIAILAGLLFPVFSAAKKSAKKTDCLSNLHEIGETMILYLSDSDDVYPQSRQSSSNPEIDDADGSIEQPVYNSAFAPLLPYTGESSGNSTSIVRPLFTCKEDSDPFGRQCFAIDPDSQDVTSYIENGTFAFGLNLSSVVHPADLILFSERRSIATTEWNPYCSDIYHPWFNDHNPKAPDNDMDALNGAVATERHSGISHFAMVDCHIRAMHWSQTFSLPTLNLHHNQ